VDQHGVEDTVFCEVNITMCYSCTRTAKFAHMNGHWKACDFHSKILLTQERFFKLDN